MPLPSLLEFNPTTPRLTPWVKRCTRGHAHSVQSFQPPMSAPIHPLRAERIAGYGRLISEFLAVHRVIH